jgi:hypothetical protein
MYASTAVNNDTAGAGICEPGFTGSRKVLVLIPDISQYIR